MKTMYRIMGKYKGQTEEIDTAETEKEAQYLQGEYQLAYGAQWQVWIEGEESA